MKFWKYLGLRLMTWALTIWIGVTFIFFIPRMFPSDPVENMIGQMQSRSGQMDPAQKEALRRFQEAMGEVPPAQTDASGAAKTEPEKHEKHEKHERKGFFGGKKKK